MSQQRMANTTALSVRPLNSKEVFALLGDSFRRQIIRALSTGEMKRAVELNAASGRKRHAYTRHIAALCKAGILIQKENPQDGRQPLYTFGPHVALCRTSEFITVDFGCCMLRFRIGR